MTTDDMTTYSYSRVAQKLAGKARASGSFEPWLFFPRGWDWPWLSFEESQACVEAWAGSLSELFEGNRGSVQRCAESVPETVLLRLALASSGSRFALSSRKVSRKDGVDSCRTATLRFQSSPIRPELAIDLEYEMSSEPMTEESSETAVEGGRLHISLPGIDRPVVLATGIVPPAALLEAVLDADAALVLEPVGSSLAGDLRLRPNVLFLRSGESQLLRAALKQSSDRPGRMRKQLRAALAAVRLVILEQPEELGACRRVDSWNSSRVDFVTLEGTSLCQVDRLSS